MPALVILHALLLFGDILNKLFKKKSLSKYIGLELGPNHLQILSVEDKRGHCQEKS